MFNFKTAPLVPRIVEKVRTVDSLVSEIELTRRIEQELKGLLSLINTLDKAPNGFKRSHISGVPHGIKREYDLNLAKPETFRVLDYSLTTYSINDQVVFVNIPKSCRLFLVDFPSGEFWLKSWLKPAISEFQKVLDSQANSQKETERKRLEELERVQRGKIDKADTNRSDMKKIFNHWW